MATGTSLVEVDPTRRPPTRADVQDDAARPRPRLVIRRLLLLGLVAAAIAVGGVLTASAPADAAPAESRGEFCADRQSGADPYVAYGDAAFGGVLSTLDDLAVAAASSQATIHSPEEVEAGEHLRDIYGFTGDEMWPAVENPVVDDYESLYDIGEWILDQAPEHALPDLVGDAGNIVTNLKVFVACIPDNAIWVKCRDENSNWPDDTGIVLVRDDHPAWWYEEVAVETTSDEGDSCAFATNPPSPTCEEIVRWVGTSARAPRGTGPRIPRDATPEEREEIYQEWLADREDAAPPTGNEYRTLPGYEAPGLIPDKCWGTYPTALYEVSWNEGSNWDAGNWDDNLLGWLTSLQFGIAKGAVQAVQWLVEFGFLFNIAQYGRAVVRISDSYQKHLVGPFNLIDIMWFALVAWVATTALRGRLAKAGGELLMTIALLTLATTLFNGRLSYFDSTARTMDLSSSAMLAAARGQDPTDSYSVQRALEPLQYRIHEQFVELPLEYLNWGEVITEPECQQAADEVVATGHDRGGWPNRHMRRAGEDCRRYAFFNKDADNSRAFGALLTLVVAIIVALTLGITAFTVLVCKFLLAVLFATTPFILLSAVLPGTGRRLFWSWCASLFQLVVAVVGCGGLLALEMIGVDAVLGLTQDQELIERWFLVLMVVATVFFARRKMMSSIQRSATNLADNLTRLSPGSANWAGGGPVGFDLDRADRVVTGGAKGIGRGAARTAGVAAWVGAIGLGAAANMGINFGSNMFRDMRNRRFAARNLAYNRQMLHQYDMRPKTVFERDLKTGKVTATKQTMELPDAVTPREMARNQRSLNAYGGRATPAAVEVFEHGKLPGTDRRLSTYYQTFREQPGPTPSRTPRQPRPSKAPTVRPGLSKWTNARQKLQGAGRKAQAGGLNVWSKINNPFGRRGP